MAFAKFWREREMAESKWRQIMEASSPKGTKQVGRIVYKLKTRNKVEAF